MKLILALYLLATSAAFAGDLWFSQMENGDKVEVTKHSVGCFHDTTVYYEISKDDGLYSFTEYAISWKKGLPDRMLEKKTVGHLMLGGSDIKGLDELLKFYRGPKQAVSTTCDSLLVEYYEAGSRIKVESLQDESAGYGLEGRKNVVTFFGLTTRFQKPGVAP